MANLYGRLQGHRGVVSRTGTKTIWARLENWENALSVELAASGDFSVTLGPKSGFGDWLIRGNVKTRCLEVNPELHQTGRTLLGR